MPIALTERNFLNYKLRFRNTQGLCVNKKGYPVRLIPLRKIKCRPLYPKLRADDEMVEKFSKIFIPIVHTSPPKRFRKAELFQGRTTPECKLFDERVEELYRRKEMKQKKLTALRNIEPQGISEWAGVCHSVAGNYIERFGAFIGRFEKGRHLASIVEKKRPAWTQDPRFFVATGLAIMAVVIIWVWHHRSQVLPEAVFRTEGGHYNPYEDFGRNADRFEQNFARADAADRAASEWMEEENHPNQMRIPRARRPFVAVPPQAAPDIANRRIGNIDLTNLPADWNLIEAKREELRQLEAKLKRPVRKAVAITPAPEAGRVDGPSATLIEQIGKKLVRITCRSREGVLSMQGIMRDARLLVPGHVFGVVQASDGSQACSFNAEDVTMLHAHVDSRFDMARAPVLKVNFASVKQPYARPSPNEHLWFITRDDLGVHCETGQSLGERSDGLWESTVATKPGDCGGVYLNAKGAIVGFHIASGDRDGVNCFVPFSQHFF
jgi:hypothetical protein